MAKKIIFLALYVSLTCSLHATNNNTQIIETKKTLEIQKALTQLPDQDLNNLLSELEEQNKEYDTAHFWTELGLTALGVVVVVPIAAVIGILGGASSYYSSDRDHFDEVIEQIECSTCSEEE